MATRASALNRCALLAGGAGAWLLAACGAGGPTGDSAQGTGAPRAAVGPSRLQMWYGLGGQQGAHVARVNERFTGEHPQIQVELLTVPELELTAKLAAALAAGSPPDLAGLGASRLAEQIERKRVVSLRRYRRDLARLDWYDAPGRVVVRGEDVFAMPVQTGALALYYNADLYQKAGLDPTAPPTTWDALLANAKAIARPEQERWGHAIGTAPIAWTAEQVWVASLWQAGGEWLTPDGRRAAFNSAAGVEALQFWADLVQKHQVVPRKAIDNLVMAGDFEAGTVGHMTIYPSWALRAEGMRFPVRTAPLPRHRRPATVASVVAIPLFAESRQQDAAWTYLDWLSRPDHLIFYLSGLGGIPPRAAIAELAAWKAFVGQHPLLQAFVDSLPEARVAYVGTGAQDIAVLVAQAIEAAVFAQTSPKQALDDAARRADAVLARP